MKKYILFMGFIELLLLYTSCSIGKKAQAHGQQQHTVNLNKNAYTPGLGDFMTTIQLHHSKLWFAGNNQNWPLAKYETAEMRETFENILKYRPNHPINQTISMMVKPVLDSVDRAILSKNISNFKSAYVLLTNTCNSCHRETKHAFNVIIIPKQPPVTDQQFSLKQNK